MPTDALLPQDMKPSKDSAPKKTVKELKLEALKRAPITPPAGYILSAPIDFTSNPKNEGLYEMYGRTGTGDDLGQLKVPYSMVQKYLDSGGTFHGGTGSQERYTKDKAAEGKKPGLLARMDTKIQQSLAPVASANDKGAITNADRAAGRAIYGTGSYLVNLAKAAKEVHDTGNADEFAKMIDPAQIPVGLHDQWKQDWATGDKKLAVDNLLGSLVGLGVVGAVTHGATKAVGGGVNALRDKFTPVAESPAGGLNEITGQTVQGAIPSPSQPPSATEGAGTPRSEVGQAGGGGVSSVAGGGQGGSQEGVPATGEQVDDGLANGRTDRGTLQGVAGGEAAGIHTGAGGEAIHNNPQNDGNAPSPVQNTPDVAFNREKEEKPTWYLKSERLVGDKMKGPAPAEDVHKMLLSGGVKPEEMQWTGLDDFLKSKGKDKVTPEEIREHLANNNLQVKEVTKGAVDPNRVTYKIVPREGSYPEMEVYLDGNLIRDDVDDFDEKESTPEELQGLAMQVARSKIPASTKFSGYQLGGGENYREMLITMPPKEPLLNRYEVKYNPDALSHEAWEIRENGQVKGYADGSAKANAMADNLFGRDWRNKNPVQPDNYQSPHWNEPNVLAHVRFNDRSGPNGEKLLHIEEVQSDWGQSGRKRGFSDPKIKEDLADKANAAKAKYDEIEKQLEASRNELLYQNLEGTQEKVEELKTKVRSEMAQQSSALEELRTAKRQSEDYARKTVPEMPFSKSWHEMAMRRMLHHASTQGYDGISWTGGEEQNDRYDLSKQVSSVQLQGTGATRFLVAFDKLGHKIIDEAHPNDSTISDVIGKDVAQKLLEQEPDERGNRTLAGVDLKVGGSGMKGFYDKIIPDYLNRFGKKYGAKVGATEIPAGEDFAYKYDGPERTLDDIKKLREITSTSGDDKFKTPFMEGKSDYPVNRVAVDGPARDVENAMSRGMKYQEAIHKYGTPELAHLLGGELTEDPTEIRKKVQYLPITPEMRQSVTEEGVPLFNRLYKSPDAPQEEIDDVQQQLKYSKDILEKHPMPETPSDLSTPEKRAAWNEDKEDWNNTYGFYEDHIRSLERNLDYHKNKSIGELRQLPDKTKIVYLTRKGLDDLHEAFGSSYSPQFFINGASLDKSDIPAVFKNLDEYKSPHARELKKLITQGLDDKGNVTIAMVPEKGQTISEALATLREELGHTWQKRFEVAAGKHLPESSFKELNDAIPEAMRDYLKQNDYKDDDGTDKANKFRVLESAAKMMADSPKALGLNEDEWAAYLFQYFDSVEKAHGKDALDELKHITTPARHVKEDYYNAKGTGSESEADRGVLGGVQGGGEGSPEGTGSEEKPDGGAASSDSGSNGGLQEEEGIDGNFRKGLRDGLERETLDGTGKSSQSTVAEAARELPPVTVITLQGGTQLASAPQQERPVEKVHTSVPHQTTASVSVPLETAMGATSVVTKRVLPLSQIMALAAMHNPSHQVGNVRDLIKEAKRRDPTKIIP
jgi:hypothetical protein